MDSDRELMLVAVIAGKHIGNCSLMGSGEYRRYQHRCSVAIALYQEYCGRCVLDDEKIVTYSGLRAGSYT